MTDKKKHTKIPVQNIEGSAVPQTPGEHSEGESTQVEESKTVTVPLKDYADQLKEIDELKANAKEFMDGWQRERADYANYRKRIEREQVDMKQNLTGEIAKRYLVVLDDIERALKAKPTEGEAASWSEGIELIYRKLQDILEKEGVQRIPAEKEEFNPHRHEAVTHEESPDHKEGQIIEVIQQGYTIGDRVLRPALVRVAK